MKKKFFLIGSCSGKEKVKNDLKKMNLYGKVKTVKEFRYKEVEKFGEYAVDSIEIGFADVSHNFNEKGNLINSVIYPLGILGDKTIHIYDGEGNVIESIFYNSDGSLKFLITSKYDNKRLKIEETYMNKNDSIFNGKSIYRYDKNGNQIEYNFINYTGIHEIISKYKYDDMGNQIEADMLEPDGSLKFMATSKYDEMGNQIETDMFEPDGSLKSRAISKYDEMNNKIEYIEYNSDGNIGSVLAYEYKYDENKNWISQIVYSNKIQISVIVRKFKYY